MYSEKSEAALVLHQTLSKTQTVKDLYTPKGNCKGCGECCSRFLPMSEFDMQRLSNYVFKHNVKVHEVVKGTLDLTCPYLDKNKECAVYTARPEICRAYRCDKHVHGEIPGFYGIQNAEVVDMLEVAITIESVRRDYYGTSDDEPCGILAKE